MIILHPIHRQQFSCSYDNNIIQKEKIEKYRNWTYKWSVIHELEREETFPYKQTKHENKQANSDAVGGRDESLCVRTQCDNCSNNPNQKGSQVLIHFFCSLLSFVLSLQDGKNWELNQKWRDCFKCIWTEHFSYPPKKSTIVGEGGRKHLDDNSHFSTWCLQ